LVPELSQLVIQDILHLECWEASKLAKEYIIERQLSLKKSSPVVIARKSDNSRVVVKFFLNNQKTAKREREMLQTCKSPHVIPLISYGRIPKISLPYLVLPYIEDNLYGTTSQEKRKLFVQLLEVIFAYSIASE
jgi:hypothetical protein